MTFPKKLLAIDTNAKTVKGRKYGFMTGILYMAPSNISGHQVCPMARLAKCEQACLYTAGRGRLNSVQKSRVNKAQLFHSQRAEFMARLAADIGKLVAKATKAGMVPLVRLNGTSDIRWEQIPVTYQGRTYPSMMQAFPRVQFYDYTKLSNRRAIPENYDLTFSYSGVSGYQKHVRAAIDAGMRVAVVFRRRADIPAEFMGLPVVDGDDSDIRHLDPQGVIVALYAKGPARADASGFVVDSPRVIPIARAA